jgi:hypothetical protein
MMSLPFMDVVMKFVAPKQPPIIFFTINPFVWVWMWLNKTSVPHPDLTICPLLHMNMLNMMSPHLISTLLLIDLRRNAHQWV